MKRSARKLELRAETVRQLDVHDLGRAAGGFYPDPTTAATDGNNGLCP